MIILLIFGGHFEFFIPKNSSRLTALHRPRYIIGAVHAQSKEKQTFMSKNKATPMITGPHCFYRQKY